MVGVSCVTWNIRGLGRKEKARAVRKVVLLPKSLSDHNAVVMETSRINWGPKPFRLFNYIMDEVGFKHTVERKIEELKKGKRKGIEVLIKESKEVIRTWSKNSRLQLLRLIEDLEKSISDKEALIQQRNQMISMEDIAKDKNELWSLYKKDELIWYQKSRANWIQNGDRNTRYFHQCASNRGRVNALKTLDVSGNLISDPKQIKSFIHEYFRDIYNLQPTVEVEHLDLNFKWLSEDESVLLERNFSEEEIWDSIASSESNKAPV
ncbi:uncharacterized protein LOC120171138 [Hibiscus syriacus]|uniref:uncharacterized protein LOC120171138 n=1 Tax=Hibiscus syriacus TaxID=106335 RepID=UPI001920959B|nr:uncharacterized protein LOC120171138 [Hibiscus syriacus]